MAHDLKPSDRSFASWDVRPGTACRSVSEPGTCFLGSRDCVSRPVWRRGCEASATGTPHRSALLEVCRQPSADHAGKQCQLLRLSVSRRATCLLCISASEVADGLVTDVCCAPHPNMVPSPLATDTGCPQPPVPSPTVTDTSVSRNNFASSSKARTSKSRLCQHTLMMVTHAFTTMSSNKQCVHTSHLGSALCWSCLSQ